MATVPELLTERVAGLVDLVPRQYRDLALTAWPTYQHNWALSPSERLKAFGDLLLRSGLAKGEAVHGLTSLPGERRPRVRVQPKGEPPRLEFKEGSDEVVA
jgi:hypothetical protein